MQGNDEGVGAYKRENYYQIEENYQKAHEKKRLLCTARSVILKSQKTIGAPFLSDGAPMSVVLLRFVFLNRLFYFFELIFVVFAFLFFAFHNCGGGFCHKFRI